MWIFKSGAIFIRIYENIVNCLGLLPFCFAQQTYTKSRSHNKSFKLQYKSLQVTLTLDHIVAGYNQQGVFKQLYISELVFRLTVSF